MKVFIVEDSEIILVHLRRIVSEVPGAIVLGEATRQDDAVAGICGVCPDVVILDLALAQGNGIEVLRLIRQRDLTATVIVLTNKVDALYRKRSLDLGADYFLDKSRDMDSLPALLAMLDT